MGSGCTVQCNTAFFSLPPSLYEVVSWRSKIAGIRSGRNTISWQQCHRHIHIVNPGLYNSVGKFNVQRSFIYIFHPFRFHLHHIYGPNRACSPPTFSASGTYASPHIVCSGWAAPDPPKEGLSHTGLVWLASSLSW